MKKKVKIGEMTEARKVMSLMRKSLRKSLGESSVSKGLRIVEKSDGTFQIQSFEDGKWVFYLTKKTIADAISFLTWDDLEHPDNYNVIYKNGSTGVVHSKN